jgi:hypothetical protein
MGNKVDKQSTKIDYAKVVPKTKLPHVQVTKKSDTRAITPVIGCSDGSNSSTKKIDAYKNTHNHTKKSKKKINVVQITTDINSDEGVKELNITIDHEEFVRLFMDPRIELSVGSLAYLIGYKMIYIVDGYRVRIPNVIAIATLKINANNNVIFQSEGKHTKKDHYTLINLSKRLGDNEFYNRDSQAESLKHTGGDMVAWEHSTKYCAHNVETLALTFCGKFKDVIRACQLYDSNMAFAESAYTHEEDQEPVVYEVGKTNYSKTEVPNVSSGKCLDFFHFFLRPEYAIDYGFWQFQLSDGRSDVNKSEIVLGKKFSGLRKISGYNSKIDRDRSDVRLVKTDSGYVSNQIIKNIEDQTESLQKDEELVDAMMGEAMEELKTTVLPDLPPPTAPMAETESTTVSTTIYPNVYPDLNSVPVPMPTAPPSMDDTGMEVDIASATSTTTLPNFSSSPKSLDAMFYTSAPKTNEPLDLLTSDMPASNVDTTILPMYQSYFEQEQNIMKDIKHEKHDTDMETDVSSWEETEATDIDSFSEKLIKSHPQSDDSQTENTENTENTEKENKNGYGLRQRSVDKTPEYALA